MEQPHLLKHISCLHTTHIKRACHEAEAAHSMPAGQVVWEKWICRMFQIAKRFSCALYRADASMHKRSHAHMLQEIFAIMTLDCQGNLLTVSSDVRN
jgi:hypothetical protein